MPPYPNPHCGLLVHRVSDNIPAHRYIKIITFKCRFMASPGSLQICTKTRKWPAWPDAISCDHSRPFVVNRPFPRAFRTSGCNPHKFGVDFWSYFYTQAPGVDQARRVPAEASQLRDQQQHNNHREFGNVRHHRNHYRTDGTNYEGGG